MSDFAEWLRRLREDAGLNQRELAERAGYTASYVSMLESRKKPPPSDEVVRRLAEALGVDESQLLEHAHLERTPYDIKEQFQTLRHRLERDSRVYEWFTGPFQRQILPLLLGLVASPPPGLARAPAALSPPPSLRKFQRRLLAAGEREPDRAKIVEAASRLSSELDLDALHALLEWLPETLVYVPESRTTPRPNVHRLPIFIEVPWEPVAHAAENSGGWKVVPESLYAPGRYCLIASGTSMYPKIEEGDFVVVDEDMRPDSGDLVAAIVGGQGRILRYIEAGDQVELAPMNPQFPPVRFPTSELDSPEAPKIRGVVVEIHRETK